MPSPFASYDARAPDQRAVLGFDSTDLHLIILPNGGAGFVIVCYADAAFANETLARTLFPNAWILPLTCIGRIAAGIDWEPGNAQPDPYQWWRQARAAGIARPVFYADLSDMRGSILPSLRAGGVPRSEYGVFVAHPTGVEHLCGPGTCEQLDVPADGTQWAWNPGGVNIDADVFNASFFQPTPAPHPPEDTVTGPYPYKTADNRIGFVVGTASGEVKHIEQQAPSGVPGGNSDFWRNADKSANWLSLGKP